jgi:hypothetical protein
VTALQPLGTRTRERLKHELMDIAKDALAIRAEQPDILMVSGKAAL